MNKPVLREPQIRNIKAGFRYRASLLSCDGLRLVLASKSPRFFHNFVLFKDLFTYTIFWSGGYINITGVKNEDELTQAYRHVRSLLDIQDCDIVKNVEIQNICASGCFSSPLDLRTIYNQILSEKIDKATLNTSFFPALFVKIKSGGTIVIFRNGKFSIVGVRDKAQIQQVLDRATHIARI